MKWIDRLFKRRGKTEGQEKAEQFLREVRAQRPEVRKLTHSLRTETDEINHIGARLRLAMEVRRDTQ